MSTAHLLRCAATLLDDPEHPTEQRAFCAALIDGALDQLRAGLDPDDVDVALAFPRGMLDRITTWGDRPGDRAALDVWFLVHRPENRCVGAAAYAVADVALRLLGYGSEHTRRPSLLAVATARITWAAFERHRPDRSSYERVKEYEEATCRGPLDAALIAAGIPPEAWPVAERVLDQVDDVVKWRQAATRIAAPRGGPAR